MTTKVTKLLDSTKFKRILNQYYNSGGRFLYVSKCRISSA